MRGIRCYAHDRVTGEKAWVFDPGVEEVGDKLDSPDYHHVSSFALKEWCIDRVPAAASALFRNPDQELGKK